LTGASVAERAYPRIGKPKGASKWHYFPGEVPYSTSLCRRWQRSSVRAGYWGPTGLMFRRDVVCAACWKDIPLAIPSRASEEPHGF